MVSEEVAVKDLDSLNNILDMFVVNYKNSIGPSFGFIKPYNAVRDSETYSLTYFPTSMVNGISERLFGENEINHIVRHKLSYDTERGLQEEGVHTVVNSFVDAKEITSIHKKNFLTDVCVTLAFNTLEEAKHAQEQAIYVGQFEYALFPKQEDIVEMTDEEFSSITGVETFAASEDDENSLFVGFNRFKDNERMYITIDRKING